MDEQALKHELHVVLNEFHIAARTIHTKKDDNPTSLMSVEWHDGEVTLIYSISALQIIGDLELRPAMRHELCHIVTSPDPRVPALSVGNVYIERAALHYIDLFREYLADREFHRRFPDDQNYIRLKRRIFRPDDTLAAFLKSHEPNPFDFFLSLFSIYYDSIYFMFVRDSTFETWCAAKHRQGWHELFQYVLEDVAHIDGLNIQYMNKLNMMLSSFYAVICIDAETLWSTGEVKLINNINRSAIGDRQLANLWKRRNLRHC